MSDQEGGARDRDRRRHQASRLHIDRTQADRERREKGKEEAVARRSSPFFETSGIRRGQLLPLPVSISRTCHAGPLEPSGGAHKPKNSLFFFSFCVCNNYFY